MHYAPGNSQHLLFLFHKGLKTLLNLKFYKMQIELCVHTSQPLTAPPLIVDVQSCNLIFINADCFDHSVAILCGAFPALHRRWAVTAIRNIALPSPADHTALQNAAWLPEGSTPAALSLRRTQGSRFAQGSTAADMKEFRSQPAAPSSSYPQPLFQV